MILAMRKMRIGPGLAWSMAYNTDDYYHGEYTPQEALTEELSYWAQDGV
jgi:hypothetical protein